MFVSLWRGACPASYTRDPDSQPAVRPVALPATSACLQLCLLILDLACTAGLGIFEYMLLAEELKAEPVWVFNSGNSHTEFIPNDKLHPFVEDVLQSIEFVTGV